MGFISDLKFGEAYELEFIKYIQHDKYIKPQGKFKDYDLKCYLNGKITRYEIKSDRLMNKTGNIAIEFNCNNSPSGIESTRATYWGIFEVISDIEYQLYIIPTKKIRKLIEQKQYKKIVAGGDGFRAKMFLFDKKLFQEYIINI